MFEIPLAETTLGDEEIDAAVRVLKSKWLTMGEEVAAFETEFARALGCKHAVAVSNGTTALEVSLVAAGIGQGDEVIIPSITFIACFNALRRINARVILADATSEDDLAISPQDVKKKITPQTKCIMPMPYAGFCPDMGVLEEVAAKHQLTMIEDACHAPLAELDGKKIGTFGLAGTWSFFGNKNMTTGEGGMITTDDDDFAAECRLLRSHGITKTTWDRARGHASGYDVARVGTNARMDEIRAAIGRVQLAKLPDSNRRRTNASIRLRERINSKRIDGLQIPFQHPRGKPVHHVFVVLLPTDANRAEVMESMRQDGIQTSIHYLPLHRFTATRGYFQDVELPVTELVEERIMTLPLSPHLTEEQIDRIAASLLKAVDQGRK